VQQEDFTTISPAEQQQTRIPKQQFSNSDEQFFENNKDDNLQESDDIDNDRNYSLLQEHLSTISPPEQQQNRIPKQQFSNSDENNKNDNLQEDDSVIDNDRTTTTISVQSPKSECCACPPLSLSSPTTDETVTTVLTDLVTNTETVPNTETTITETVTTETVTESETVSTTDLSTTDLSTTDLSTTTEMDVEETSTMLDRDGRQFLSDEDTTVSPIISDNPILQYFERLRKIYELDLKILEQLADLLAGVDEEVLPAIMTTLEPILPLLMSQQIENADLGQIIGYVAQTVQKSTFHVAMSAHLGDLDFLDIGN
jgi:hypothetical protein